MNEHWQMEFALNKRDCSYPLMECMSVGIGPHPFNRLLISWRND